MTLIYQTDPDRSAMRFVQPTRIQVQLIKPDLALALTRWSVERKGRYYPFHSRIAIRSDEKAICSETADPFVPRIPMYGCRYWDEGRMDLSLIEEFGALIGCGWTDVWRLRNPMLRSGLGLSLGDVISALD